MVTNISYNNRDRKQEINNLLGKPYPFLHRLKTGGNGSPRFVIKNSSNKIQELLDKDNNRSYCNIELRPKGIVLSFRSILESYGWIVPFYQLSVYKSGDSYNLYAGSEFVSLKVLNRNDSKKFFSKLLTVKTEFLKSYDFVS